jgi:preprotein translocase subunit SecA
LDLTLEPNPVFRLVYDAVASELKDELEAVKNKPLTALGRALRERLEKPIAKALALGRDRFVMLRVVDSLWVRHLTDLDELKEGIGLRAFGHQDPLIAFKREAHEMYEDLLAQIRDQIAQGILYTSIAIRRPEPAIPRAKIPSPAHVPSERKRLGRNDPCWCGSGKKYKHCHMRQDEAMARR